MTGPYGETIVVHRRGIIGQDGDGNDIYGDVDTTYPKATVYPRRSTELVQGQTTNIIGLTVVLKPAIEIGPNDEVTVRGERWGVDADPGLYRSSLTGLSITEINLKRVTG